MKNPNTMRIVFLISVCLVWSCVAGVFFQKDPIWQTSPYFRASNEKVIRQKTGNSSRPSYTFTFSSALSGIPNLAYGVKGYQGNDFLGQQNWQIQRQDPGVNQTHFSVYIQIYGVTNLNILNVAYIACQPKFPHHLNSFDNVPISYKSKLINITQPQQQTVYYTNYINYTEQAAGRRFTKFTTPLKYNKVILFMSSIFIYASFKNGSKYYPVQIDVQATVQSQDTYKLKGTFYTKFYLERLHFSMIIFNEKDVAATNQYFLEFFVWTTPVSGGFIPVPEQFKDNFILALKDFDTIDGKCGIEYSWQFTTKNGVHGVLMDPSIISYGSCGQNQTRSTVFYMKTWNCPDQYKYFNLTSNKCQNGCGDYFFQNFTQLACDPCWFSCQQCEGASSSQCKVCSEDVDHRQKAENGSCTCISGYYDDYQNPLCPACSQIAYKCKNCYHVPSMSGKPVNTQYPCFECFDGYFYQKQSFKCVNYVSCDASKSQFVNITINQCEVCTVIGCKTCGTLYSCKTCDASNEYFPSITNTLVCQKCKRAQGCLFCKSLNTCVTCDQNIGYFLDKTVNICRNCTYGCQSCQATTQKCTKCNQAKGIYLNKETGKCECQSGKFLDQGLEHSQWTCKFCHQQCFQCTGPTRRQCTACNISQNRLLNGSQCPVCRLQGCSTCETFEKCNACNQTAKYQQDPQNPAKCKKCRPPIGCKQCKTLSTCTECVQDKGYYMNSKEVCVDCSAGCLKCDPDTLKCSECKSGFILNKQLNACECQNGKYVVRSSTLCIQCNRLCATCNGPSQYHCTSCNASHQRIFVGNICRCRPNYKEPEVSSTTCVVIEQKTCQPGYVFVESAGNCKANCGDGLVIENQQQCDDGNSRNGDGCTKNCKIQADYTCIYLPGETPQSLCDYNKPVTMEVLKVNKKKSSNTLEVTTTIQPKISVLGKVDWKKEIKVEGLGQVTIKDAVYNQTTGKLTFNVDYQKVPSGDQSVKIKISGGETSTSQTNGQTLKAAETMIDFGTIQSTNNINAAGVYSDETYQSIQTAQTMVTASMAVALGAAGVSLLIKNAVPAMQLVVAMQASYISLATLTDVHPLLATLYNADSLSGYNDQFSMDSESSSRLLSQLQSPNLIQQSNILALGYESSFFANCNIMLIVQGVVLLLVCFTYLLSIKNAAFKTPYKYFQRTLMVLIVFNTNNIVFSMSLISSAYILDLALAVIAACMILGQILHLCLYYKGYLGMETTFQIHKVRFKTYFISMMLARISIAIIPSVLKDSPQISVSVNLAIQAVLCIIMTIIRPFAHKGMNAIMLVGEYTLLAFLVSLQVSTSLKDTITIDQQFGLILAWVQIGIFGFLSIVCMISAIFGTYTQLCGTKKTKAKVNIEEQDDKKPQTNGSKEILDGNSSQFKLQDIQAGDYMEISSPTIHSPQKIDLDRLLN